MAYVAHRLMGFAAASQQLAGPSGPTPLRCSIGIALSDPTITSADLLIHRADSALYLAKGQGGNRVAWHDPLESPDARPRREDPEHRDDVGADGPRDALTCR